MAGQVTIPQDMAIMESKALLELVEWEAESALEMETNSLFQ